MLSCECQQAHAGFLPTEAEQQLCYDLQLRLWQQATWSDKINTLTICSHRLFFQLFLLKLADYHVAYSIFHTRFVTTRFALLRLSILTPDKCHFHSCEHVCVCVHMFPPFIVTFHLCVLCACWYLYLYILYIPAPSSGYPTCGGWIHCPVSWNDLPRQELGQSPSNTEPFTHNQARNHIIVPPKLASLLSRVTGTFLSLALSLS